MILIQELNQQGMDIFENIIVRHKDIEGEEDLINTYKTFYQLINKRVGNFNYETNSR